MPLGLLLHPFKDLSVTPQSNIWSAHKSTTHVNEKPDVQTWNIVKIRERERENLPEEILSQNQTVPQLLLQLWLPFQFSFYFVKWIPHPDVFLIFCNAEQITCFYYLVKWKFWSNFYQRNSQRVEWKHCSSLPCRIKAGWWFNIVSLPFSWKVPD